ncbi:MAG: M3 family oligoendopeptidase [Caldilineaceae bacterium SB0662_bin_9]|uniref:M3 family oligoendopeptidase n=1 Tax=Caldilineaceae bacterium SB0662_bin_9 TaxID=2605258 RepID=A0A6B1DUH2_9CHLR|nr:M3 family oligoendopeptidase [Caldilineaceae bacterium]MYD91369.1 M3 family oligoendopeptidase [Caldilineaceae bacterium SB0662_bin_9]
MGNRYELSGWQLTDLLPDAEDDTVQAHLAALTAAVEQFEGQRAALEAFDQGEQNLDLVPLMQQLEDISERMYVLGAYGSLWFSADTQSEEALRYEGYMQQELTNLQNRVIFFDLWWKSLGDEQAAALLPDPEQYPDYAYSLQSDRRFCPFTLDEQSEQIINTKDANGMSSLITVFSMLTNRLEFTLEVDGETQTLTREELMQHAYSSDAALRETAYRELFRVYEQENGILGQIYAARVRDWHSENLGLRNYSSPIAVKNLGNNVPDAAVEALLQVCQDNAGLFQEYFRLKAKWLGLEKLRRFDIYAPLGGSDKQIDYGDAVDLVLETVDAFDSGVAAKAERVFRDGHIDSEIRKGKRSGAFCATVLPSQTPWILMNYTGRVRDVATLAHELGHAIHSLQAEDHSLLTQHAPLPLAETASVFTEMLLTDRLMQEETDPLVRRELLATAVDDMYATVMRQAYFVVFEKAAHEAVLQNKSTGDLSEIYQSQLAQQFGDAVDVDDIFAHEWLMIPHIYHTPFYCYAYSFGQLLVLALYRRYQQEGEAFKPGYLQLLAYGGSKDPDDILQEMGIDMSDPAFWQGGFDVCRDMIDQLKELDI